MLAYGLASKPRFGGTNMMISLFHFLTVKGFQVGMPLTFFCKVNNVGALNQGKENFRGGSWRFLYDKETFKCTIGLVKSIVNGAFLFNVIS